MYNSIADLERAWSAVVENTREALNWLDRNRNSRYLENEYDSCCAGLAEQLEYAARMKDNCSKTNSVGIFGESQAGKSFLVSTAAAEVRSAQGVKPWIFCGISTLREAARNPPEW